MAGLATQRFAARTLADTGNAGLLAHAHHPAPAAVHQVTLQLRHRHIARRTRAVPVQSVAELRAGQNLLGDDHPVGCLTFFHTRSTQADTFGAGRSAVEGAAHGVAFSVLVRQPITVVVNAVTELLSGRRRLLTHRQAGHARPATRCARTIKPSVTRVANANLGALYRAKLRVHIDRANAVRIASVTYVALPRVHAGIAVIAVRPGATRSDAVGVFVAVQTERRRQAHPHIVRTTRANQHTIEALGALITQLAVRRAHTDAAVVVQRYARFTLAIVVRGAQNHVVAAALDVGISVGVRIIGIRLRSPVDVAALGPGVLGFDGPIRRTVTTICITSAGRSGV